MSISIALLGPVTHDFAERGVPKQCADTLYYVTVEEIELEVMTDHLKHCVSPFSRRRKLVDDLIEHPGILEGESKAFYGLTAVASVMAIKEKEAARRRTPDISRRLVSWLSPVFVSFAHRAISQSN